MSCTDCEKKQQSRVLANGKLRATKEAIEAGKKLGLSFMGIGVKDGRYTHAIPEEAQNLEHWELISIPS